MTPITNERDPVREAWIDTLVGAYSHAPGFQPLARTALNAASNEALNFPLRLLFPLYDAWKLITPNSKGVEQWL